VTDRPRPLTIDRELLSQSVGRLRENLTAEFGVDEAIHRVVEASVELFGLTGAGLMLVDGDEVPRAMMATDQGGAVLEAIQEELGEGPCVDSILFDRVVTSEDVRRDARWPVVGERLDGHRVGGVLGVPVRLAGGPVAALNVYRDEPQGWNEGDVEALSAFGRILETVLATAVLANRQDELVQQLQRALDNRVEIERAVGMMMGRHGLDAREAFNRLRESARSQRRKVIDVAREALGASAGREEPDLES
jgi:GAF domain-containing protein